MKPQNNSLYLREYNDKMNTITHMEYMSRSNYEKLKKIKVKNVYKFIGTSIRIIDN